MYWLNVDRPTNTCTLHQADCSYVHGPTAFKGDNEEARDGGWFSFDTRREAEAFHRSERSHMKYRECSICFGYTD